MHFTYKAKKGPTEIVEGEVDAESEDAALGKIAALGLIPVKLEASGGQLAGIPANSKTGTSQGLEKVLSVEGKARSRIRYQDLNIFTRQFSILLKANVPLLRIFEILQIQTQHVKFRVILRSIQESLREGAALSEVLGEYPRIFSQMYVNMVQAGEVSGTLDQVLSRLAEFSEKESEIRSKVQSALIYPAFLFLVGVLTIFVLLTFVMPRLLALFADLGTQLPLPTRVMMRVSRFCQSYWMWMAGSAALITAFLRTRGLSAGQKKILDGMLVQVPLFGSLIEKSEAAKFLRSLELLYEHGIPLYRAVEVATKTVTNLVIREQLEKVPSLLEGGATLAKSLSEVPSISPFVVHMVSVGEESGQLGSAVRETASFYEQETGQFIKIATSLIEPMMILGVGVIVGFIVISMLLPIFEIHVLAQ